MLYRTHRNKYRKQADSNICEEPELCWQSKLMQKEQPQNSLEQLVSAKLSKEGQRRRGTEHRPGLTHTCLY